MKHDLFVGHFDRSVKSYIPRVIKPLDVAKVIAVFRTIGNMDAEFAEEYLDTLPSRIHSGYPEPVGYVGHSVIIWGKRGYLQCPWLNPGIVWESFAFIVALVEELGVDVWCPDDERFFSIDDLRPDERAPRDPPQ